ncbi:MAG TPA: ABC transporter permease [Stellaceae bacterium]|nr:ABC transporter permease [Stellaceae bacterium]
MSPAAALPALRRANQVLLFLVAVGLAATLVGGFVSLAPNRLVSGNPIALWDAASPAIGTVIAALGVALALVAVSPPRPAAIVVQTAAAAVVAIVVLYAAGDAAQRLAAGAPPLARIALGPGFWALFAAAVLAVLDGLQRLRAGYTVRLLVAAAILGAAAALALAGRLDALSLAHEFATRRNVFLDALLRHIALVAGSVAPAIAIGAPLGILALRRERLRGATFAILNLLQTIPSIALFGLLIVPLSALATTVPALAALGIGGIGPAPAVIALILYALLPVARSTAAGLGGIDPAVIDAARGMGMTARQVFWRVELPLAAPVLVAGLRIVTVQTIGLAVVAALIGAGGLGSFVFQGLGQDAADLVLLGALPAIGLALAADFLLQIAAAALRR